MQHRDAICLCRDLYITFVHQLNILSRFNHIILYANRKVPKSIISDYRPIYCQRMPVREIYVQEQERYCMIYNKQGSHNKNKRKNSHKIVYIKRIIINIQIKIFVWTFFLRTVI